MRVSSGSWRTRLCPLWNASGISIHRKIELYFAAVDMAAVVHRHGFDTFAKHLPYDLSCANRRGTTCENTPEVYNGGWVCLRGIQKSTLAGSERDWVTSARFGLLLRDTNSGFI